MNIYLGNLSVEQIEQRLGIELTENNRKELRSSRQEKASGIESNKWHCFDIPFTIVCGGKHFAEKLTKMLTPYADKMNCPIEIGWEAAESEGLK